MVVMAEMGSSGMRGPKGDKGDQGEQGTPGPINGGVVYTRWGKKACRAGAKLVYEGIVGGGHYNQHGNGANYLCLPKDPQYISTTPPAWKSLLYGAEYETGNRVFNKPLHDYNVPCAVCLAPKKISKLMIPAKMSCPSSLTREYYGYLMIERHNHPRNVVYECVDKDAEAIPGSKKNTNGALFYFVEAVCNHGLPCLPYQASKAVICVVCTL